MKRIVALGNTETSVRRELWPERMGREHIRSKFQKETACFQPFNVKTAPSARALHRIGYLRLEGAGLQDDTRCLPAGRGDKRGSNERRPKGYANTPLGFMITLSGQTRSGREGSSSEEQQQQKGKGREPRGECGRRKKKRKVFAG